MIAEIAVQRLCSIQLPVTNEGKSNYQSIITKEQKLVNEGSLDRNVDARTEEVGANMEYMDVHANMEQ